MYIYIYIYVYIYMYIYIYIYIYIYVYIYIYIYTHFLLVYCSIVRFITLCFLPLCMFSNALLDLVFNLL